MADSSGLPLRIASIEKNRRETLIVELAAFKGHNLVSLRVWVPDESGGQKPTPKGVTLAVALLPEVRRAFQDAEREAARLGLLTEVQA